MNIDSGNIDGAHGAGQEDIYSVNLGEPIMPSSSGSDVPAKARPYHHGALREALLAAAERLLERDGITGLTLRAAAREAGASHAAPKNHFDDLTGLLSELAAVGFNRLSDRLRLAASNQPTEQSKLNAIGFAYVEFAVANPGLFQLMFRGERLDSSRPALRKASDESYALLKGAVAAAHSVSQLGGGSLAAAARVARAWTMVHGYAMLLLDGRLEALFDGGVPALNAPVLLRAMLELE
ncbi:TetR-like C-terminal domain-containing protein [Sphingomonas sp.]|uniref:TetR-like C-terminal domain-containing protein n=1 Tax=Sphingomonas sp. TaxID=28214 RepID=UPI002E321DC5|nr:TetR-like C-terminal domain-containing protein [Sphingomonas sp.]HEX4693397.1 TetR-like C-terminal domain-containing protein [Sphingomonas sp.]